MNRKILAATVMVLMVVSLSIPATGHHKSGHSGGPPHLTTTTTTASTTTTTAATTTTVATTTTTAATTTTTILVGEIPPTAPNPGLGGGDLGFNFEIGCTDNRDTPEDECTLRNDAGKEKWWNAPYHYDLPYALGFGWVEGDRIAYACGYTFLYEDVNGNGQFDVGEERFRAGFFRIPGASYSQVNDRFMDEGEYFYDATATPGGFTQAHSGGLCKGQVENEVYEPYFGPDQNPRIVMWSDSGEAVEIRDYRNVERLTPTYTKFRLLPSIDTPFTTTICCFNDDPERTATQTVYERETVVFYRLDLPPMVVWYDSLREGFSVTSDLP